MDTYIHIKTRMCKFIAALFRITQIWRQPTFCTWRSDVTTAMHTIYSAVRGDPRNSIMPGERTQTAEAACRVVPHSGKGKRRAELWSPGQD